MTPAQIATQRAAVAKKTGIPVDKVVGPFRSDTRPSRSGLFIRIHAVSGNPNWAHFDSTTEVWGMYSGQKRNALRKKSKPSKKSNLIWYGFKG